MKLIQKDGRQEIWYKNKMLGYVNSNRALFGIGKDGYAVLIGDVEYDHKIIPELRKWRKNKNLTKR